MNEQIKSNFNQIKGQYCVNLSDGEDISEYIGNAGNPFKCLELCHNDQKCTAATFDVVDNYCYLAYNQ